MRSNMKETTVAGIKFGFYGDFIRRATFAVNMETGEEKMIYDCGYIHVDLTVRKAIANAFGMKSFRK